VSNVLTAPWGPVSLVAVIFATLLYMNLSRRLGAVTKMKPYFRGFMVAVVFITGALIFYIIRNAAYLSANKPWPWLLSPVTTFLCFHLPLFFGVLLDVLLVIRYWAWLLTEKKK
jgi:putative effector of murein hydrolase